MCLWVKVHVELILELNLFDSINPTIDDISLYVLSQGQYVGLNIISSVATKRLNSEELSWVKVPESDDLGVAASFLGAFPLEVVSLAHHSIVVDIAMLLNLKEVVRGYSISFIRPLVYPDIHWLMRFLSRLVIKAEVSSSFRMLQDNHISWEKIFPYLAIRFDLSIVDDLPLVEVLRDVGIVSLEHLVWVLSSSGWSWSVIRGLVNSLLLVEE